MCKISSLQTKNLKWLKIPTSLFTWMLSNEIITFVYMHQAFNQNWWLWLASRFDVRINVKFDLKVFELSSPLQQFRMTPPQQCSSATVLCCGVDDTVVFQTFCSWEHLIHPPRSHRMCKWPFFCHFSTLHLNAPLTGTKVVDLGHGRSQLRMWH